MNIDTNSAVCSIGLTQALRVSRPQLGAISEIERLKRQLSWTLVAVCCYLAQTKSATGTVDKASTGSSSGSFGSSTGGGGNSIDSGCTDDGVASYTRFSSDNQDVSSNDQQDAEINAAALIRGHRINPNLKCSDEAVSGTKLHRNGLNRLMELARKGQIKVLYVYSLSRLARECLIALMVLKELVHVHNVWVISVSEGIDSKNPAWDFVATILSIMHEEFIKVLRAQVIRGQVHNLENDFSCGDWGYGYGSEVIPGQENTARFKRGKPRKRVIINEEEAEIVRLIFFWFVSEGRSIRWIARELTRRGVRKEHGGRTPAWHHDTVKLLLRNEKYIGYWQWGKRKNKRIPMTGQITRELRSPEELQKWMKYHPVRRIIDDELFYQAQELLDKLANKWDKMRDGKGRLNGSTNDERQPRHLLQQAIKCGNCGDTFKTYGGRGHRLQCTGYMKTLCTVRTTLHRDVVERSLLNFIREWMLENQEWQHVFLEDFKQALVAHRKANAHPTEDVEKQLKEVRRKIDRLIVMCEGDDPDVGIKAKLRERRVEEKFLSNKLKLASEKQQAIPEEPTLEWVLEKLNNLAKVLQSEPARAGVALRNLLGPITVHEIDVPGSKRKRLVGKFTLDHARIAKAALAFDKAEGMRPPEEVTLRFAPPPPWAAVADQVMEFWEDGDTAYAISEQLQIHYSWVAKAIEWWHAERGRPAPTYLEKRQKLDKISRAEEIADEVGRMINEEIPLKEIARILKCHKDTVTAAKKIWFERNRLPVPDGRTLRRERNPNSRRRKAS